MIISEKQIMQLINFTADYCQKIEWLMEKNLANGEPENLLKGMRTLLSNIRCQQSEELKEVK